MSNVNAEILLHIRKLNDMAKPKEKQRYLQDLIGKPVDLAYPAAKAELHKRALLMSRLNDAGIWPHRPKAAA